MKGLVPHLGNYTKTSNWVALVKHLQEVGRTGLPIEVSIEFTEEETTMHANRKLGMDEQMKAIMNAEIKKLINVILFLYNFVLSLSL